VPVEHASSFHREIPNISIPARHRQAGKRAGQNCVIKVQEKK
jgi:hypothetical protein